MKNIYKKFNELYEAAMSDVNDAKDYLANDDIESAAVSIDAAKKSMHRSNKVLAKVEDASYGVASKKQLNLCKEYYGTLAKIVSKAV